MALATCSGSGSDREPGPPQQNALRQMQQKSVSEPVLYQDPQKAHALIDAFTRGLLAGAAERPRVCALQAESASRAGWARSEERRVGKECRL